MRTTTRDTGLESAVLEITPIFTKSGYTTPLCGVSCGFTITGERSGHIDQCWSKKSSTDGINQIFISPALEDTIEVLFTLIPELVHAVDDCQHKQGKELKKYQLI